MTMVASFMPSLAFAAGGHTYAVKKAADGGAAAQYLNGTSDTWADIQAALKLDEAEYVNVVKAPVHTPAGLEKGVVELKCTSPFCDHVITEDIAASHDDVDKLVQRNFTLEEWAEICLAQGTYKNKIAADKALKKWKKDGACYIKNAKVCSCGYATWVDTVVHAVNNTCVDKECPQCHEVIKATKKHVAKAVNPATAVKVSDPTCGKGTGYASKCTKCDAYAVWYDTADVKPDSHNFGTPVTADIAVTSDKTGKKIANGYVAVKVTTQATDKVVVNPTTDIVGPNEPWTKDATEAADFKFYKLNDVISEGSCTSDAKMGLKCVDCGATLNTGADTRYEANVDTDHVYESSKVEATCDKDAYMHKVCTVCGDEVNTPIPQTKLAHSYKVTKTAATCGSEEYYTIECTTCPEKCGNTHKVKYTLAGANTAAANTNTTGIEVYETNETAKTKTFAFDGFDHEFKDLPSKKLLITFSTAPVVNHKWGAETLLKEATCDKDAIWGYKCTECGKIATHEVAGKVPAEKLNTRLGHDLVKTETAATCGSYGFYTEQCSRCGLYKDADGNVDESELKNAKVVKTDKPVVKEGAKCTFDKWVVTKDSTVFEEGVKSLECSVCGADGNAKTVIAKKTVAKASNTVKAGKKSFNVKSSAANATGYRVYYKKAGAKSWKSYTKKTTSLSKTFSGLSKGKYYVKVKAYAKNYDGDGQVVWGATSSTKSVKVK